MRTTQKHRALIGVATTVAVLAVARGRAAGTASVDLAIAGHSNAYPSIAANASVVAVAWAASAQGAADVYTAISRDAGRTFAKAVRVNDAATRASVSGEQPPRIALIPRSGQTPAVVVVWTAKGSAGTRLLSARSEDGGTSFGTPATIPGSDARGNRGWESIGVDPSGRVVALWLDHRDYAVGGGSTTMHNEGPTHADHGDMDGAARAQQSKLYFGTVGGDAARAIASGVCYCCKTSVAVGADGAIYAAWRHVYPGNIRDIAFTVSRDAARTFAAPVPVSHDRWALDGCPENGPALGVDARNTVHVVWPTLVEGQSEGGEQNLALFYATRRGDQFSPRQAIPTVGTPRHPAIAVGPMGTLLIGWDEQARGSRHVAFATAAQAGGASTFTRLPDITQVRGEYPAVASSADGFLAVWTSGTAEQSAIHVERIAR